MSDWDGNTTAEWARGAADAGRNPSARTIAGCPECRRPVVATMIFRGKEWYCPTCEWKGGLLGSIIGLAYTPQVVALYEDILMEFTLNSAGYIPPGARLLNCDVCKRTNEEHRQHATADELAASDAALARLASYAAEYRSASDA